MPYKTHMKGEKTMDPKETMNDEELIKKVGEAEDIEAVLGILKENGVEATEEELTKKDEDELSDESLEEVAGGLNILSICRNPTLLTAAKIQALKKLYLKGQLKKLPGGNLIIKMLKL